jgi:hypothetical protein
MSQSLLITVLVGVSLGCGLGVCDIENGMILVTKSDGSVVGTTSGAVDTEQEEQKSVPAKKRRNEISLTIEQFLPAPVALCVFPHQSCRHSFPVLSVVPGMGRP